MVAIESLIVDFLVASLWQIGLIVVAGGVADRLFMTRVAAATRYRFWMLVSLLALGIPLASTTISGGWIAVPNWGQPSVAVLRTLAPAPALSLQAGAGGWISTELGHWVALAYIGFLIIGCGSLGHSLWRVRNLSCSGRAFGKAPYNCPVSGPLAQRLQDRGVEVRASKLFKAPGALGFWNPIILVPEDLSEQLSTQGLTAVLEHELAHLERNDQWTNLLLEFVLLPVAYHPAVWYLRRIAALYRELACDEAVSSESFGRRAYARILLLVADRGQRLGETPAGLGFHSGDLEKRIRWLIRPPEMASGWNRFLRLNAASLVLAGCTLLPLQLACASTPPLSQGPEDEPTKVVEVFDVGDPGVQAPKIVAQTVPRYTQEAIDAGLVGTVLLKCVIRRTGRVTDCEVEQALGLGLEESARDEIQQNWRFDPGTFNGEPVDVNATIEVQFNLKE